LKDPAFYSGLLLLACLHLDGVTKSSMSSEFLGVKQETVKLVRIKFSDPTTANTVGNIGPMACLANAALVSEIIQAAQMLFG
jgi:hypothetical protein